MMVLDLETPVRCSNCQHTMDRVVIETLDEGRERITCGLCKRHFYRIGWSYKFKSSDGYTIIIPELPVSL